jgi:O-methyltransferase domain/Dimerisation domain
MPSAPELVIDLIFGRWRSQILYAGAALGVFDHLTQDEAIGAAALSPKISTDPALLYRLMRALASIGMLAEDDRRGFRLTEAGMLLRENDPHSLKAMVLLEEGPEHYAAWKHLVPILRDGRQDGFLREFGAPLFEYARRNASYAAVFNRAMTSYSAVQAQWAVAALASEDFAGVHTFCDVAGGHGYLTCVFLEAYPGPSGIVFDLPEVIAETDRLWAPKLNLADRCRYVAGDMFRKIPAADAYLLKNILHDWGDAECVKILANVRRACTEGARLFAIEHVVPGPEDPHFSKLFDIHMMCVLTGRERTADEHAELLRTGGWRYERLRQAPGALQSVIVGTAI